MQVTFTSLYKHGMPANGMIKQGLNAYSSIRYTKNRLVSILQGMHPGIPAFLATESTPTNRKGLKVAGAGVTPSCIGRAGLFGSMACF